MASAPTQIPTIQQSHNKELTLHDILGILKRRKWSIILPILLTVGLAVLYTLSTPPSYRANALVQIEREGAQIVTTGQTSRSAGVFDADKDPFFRTRYEMLKSRSLSLKVIEDLNLESILAPKKKETLLSVSGLMKAIGLKSDSQNKVKASIDYSALFQKGLLVQPIDGTHLVEVVYFDFVLG